MLSNHLDAHEVMKDMLTAFRENMKNHGAEISAPEAGPVIKSLLDAVAVGIVKAFEQINTKTEED